MENIRKVTIEEVLEFLSEQLPNSQYDNLEELNPATGVLETMIAEGELFKTDDGIFVLQATADMNTETGEMDDYKVWQYPLLDWIIECDTDAPELTEAQVSEFTSLGFSMRF